jgi:hypothetical protein
MTSSLRIGSALLLGVLGFAPRAQAISFVVGDGYYMGYINDGIPSGDDKVAQYLTFLGNMAPGSFADNQAFPGPPANTQDLTRSGNMLCYNAVPALGCADATTEGIVGGNTTSVDLGSGYLYLLAKYDGPNWGTEVWYVGGLTGVHTIPAFPPGLTSLGLSHWSLFNPGGGRDDETPVPEPASLLLLGTGLAVAARRLRTKSRSTKSRSQ